MKKQMCEEKRKSQKKEDAGGQKGRKVANHCVLPMICGSGWSKVSSLERRVRSNLPTWEMKNCTPLWREAHLEVKLFKTPPVRSTLEVPKLRCRKSARRCDTKHISKSNCRKHLMFGALLEVDVEKVDAVVAKSTFPSQKCQKNWQSRKGFCTMPKVSKTWWFCSISKNDGRRGNSEEDLQRCMSRGRRSTRDMFSRDVRSGRWFPESGCILVHQIVRFAKMILRDRCSTSYDLASLFPGRRSTLDRWRKKSQNALVRGRQLCTQCFFFKEVSQNSFVFDVLERPVASLYSGFCQTPKSLKSVLEPI